MKKVQQAVRQIPWGHNIIIIGKSGKRTGHVARRRQTIRIVDYAYNAFISIVANTDINYIDISE